MATKRNKSIKRNTKGKNKTIRRIKKSNKSGKKWITAIEAAERNFKKTGSLTAARSALRSQALYNARKLFGSVKTPF